MVYFEPMKLSRTLRSVVALVALFGVLLAQVALAAYACPGADGMAVAALQAEADPPCCGEGTPEAEPALCNAHCQQGDQSLDKPAPPAPPALAAPVARVVAVREPPMPPPPGEQPSLLARTPAPPAAVRHCRFLI